MLARSRCRNKCLDGWSRNDPFQYKRLPEFSRKPFILKFIRRESSIYSIEYHDLLHIDLVVL